MLVRLFARGWPHRCGIVCCHGEVGGLGEDLREQTGGAWELDEWSLILCFCVNATTVTQWILLRVKFSFMDASIGCLEILSTSGGRGLWTRSPHLFMAPGRGRGCLLLKCVRCVPSLCFFFLKVLIVFMNISNPSLINLSCSGHICSLACTRLMIIVSFAGVSCSASLLDGGIGLLIHST